MADILIRNITPLTKERLRQRAKRRGKSLEADLRDTLEVIAREDTRPVAGQQGFGSWLSSMSRPGTDLSRILAKVRAAPARAVDFD